MARKGSKIDRLTKAPESRHRKVRKPKRGRSKSTDPLSKLLNSGYARGGFRK